MKSHIVKVTRYAYEKVEKKGTVINIPDIPTYYQEDNHRVIYGIFPQQDCLDNNNINELKVIKITPNHIHYVSIRTNPDYLSDIISHMGMKGQSDEEYIIGDVVKYLMDYFNDDRISKDYFVRKYTNYVNLLNSIIL